MGFLSDAASAPDANPATAPASQTAPTGGFLSDNPPPDETTDATQAPAPNWSDIPGKAIASAPESAIQFGKNMAHPFMHPVDTLEGVGGLALGIVQKFGRNQAGIYDKEGYYEKYPDAVGKMVMDRYGSVDNFKRTLANDPVGAAADLSTLMTGGETALARLPGIVGRVGETMGTVGKLTDPLMPIKAGASVAGKAAASTMGLETGVGMKPFEEAARAGYEGGDAQKAFEASRTGAASGDDLVRQAYGALNQIKKERGTAYNADMAPTKADTTILNWNDVGQAIRDSHQIQEFHGEGLLDEAGEKMRDKLDNVVLDWMGLPQQPFHTPAGFDALKKKIGNIRDNQEAGSSEKAIANKYYGAVRNTIIDQVPEYAKAMQGYEDASDTVRQIERTLSLPPNERRLNIDTALRKLQSTLRRNVNTNYGQRDRLIDYLENAGAPNLRSALAGQALQSPEAHGLGRILPALALFNSHSLGHAATALAVTSPRAMGYVANRAGMLARPFRYIPRQTPEIAQQVGRWLPPQQSRGGAIDRAKRLSRRKHDG